MREFELFVAVLGASNYTYAEATATQQIADWSQAHVRAFEYLGGIAGAVVPDYVARHMIGVMCPPRLCVQRPARRALPAVRRREDVAAVRVRRYGEAFNAISLEPVTGRPRNPMINAGAIASASLVAGDGNTAKLERTSAMLSVATATSPCFVASRTFAPRGEPMSVDAIGTAESRDHPTKRPSTVVLSHRSSFTERPTFTLSSLAGPPVLFAASRDAPIAPKITVQPGTFTDSATHSEPIAASASVRRIVETSMTKGATCPKSIPPTVMVRTAPSRPRLRDGYSGARDTGPEASRLRRQVAAAIECYRRVLVDGAFRTPPPVNDADWTF